MPDGVDVLAGRGDGLFLIGQDAGTTDDALIRAVLVQDGKRRSLGSVPYERPPVALGTTVIGPVDDPIALDSLGPLPDHGEARPAVDPFAVIEERLHARLSESTRLLVEVDGSIEGRSRDYAYIAHEAKELVEAIQRVSAVRQAAEALVPTPVLDADAVHRIGVEAWREASEAGASTTVADRVAAKVRELLGGVG